VPVNVVEAVAHRANRILGPLPSNMKRVPV
jgi:hypothetical protein